MDHPQHKYLSAYNLLEHVSASVIVGLCVRISNPNLNSKNPAPYGRMECTVMDWCVHVCGGGCTGVFVWMGACHYIDVPLCRRTVMSTIASRKRYKFVPLYRHVEVKICR